MLALFLGSELRWAGQPGFSLDDAWIHAVFARNVAEGRGFSFNPDEPIGGSTSPLWTLAMAGVYSLTHQMVWGTKALGALLYLAGILLSYHVVLKLTGEPTTAALAATLVALLRWNAWGALSGMEIPLYVALCLAGLYLYLAAEGSPPSLWRDLGSTICLGLASLARPESLTLFAATRLMTVTDQLRRVPPVRDIPRLLVGLVPHAFVLGVILAPFALFNYQTAGSPLPNTFDAKVGSENFLHAIAALDAGSAKRTLLIGPLLHIPILVVRLLATNAILFPFAVLGLRQLWLESRLGVLHPRSRLLPATFLLYPAAMSFVEPTSKLTYRFVATVLVIYCLIGVVGFVHLWRLSSRPPSARTIPPVWNRFITMILLAGSLLSAAAVLTFDRWRPYLSLVFHRLASDVAASEFERVAGFFAVPILLSTVVLGSLLWVLMTKGRFRAALLTLGGFCLLSQVALDAVTARRHALQVRNINSIHIATGEWIDRHLPREATVALDDIGGITYVSRRRIFDMAGLVSPEAIRYRRAGRSRVEYLRSVRPDFVATIHPRALEESPELFRPIHVVTISDNIAAANDTIVVFETVWNRGTEREHWTRLP